MSQHTINERILELRKSLHLSRDAFGSGLGVSQDVIKNLDYNITAPKDSFINLICKVYNVREEWLREGTGDMRVSSEDDDYLVERMGEYARSDISPYRRALLIEFYRNLDQISDENLPAVADAIIAIADRLKSLRQPPEPREDPDPPEDPEA